ncbi:MAG: PepSY domain-containing protein [bacterium]|nr:PepSY domain-containing protein [bacterium]
MKAETIQKLHRWHAWSGLIFGANLILFSFTGAVLVFYAELNRAVGPRPPQALLAAMAARDGGAGKLAVGERAFDSGARARLPVIDERGWVPLQPLLTEILGDYPGARLAHLQLAPARESQAEIHKDLDRFHRLDIDLPAAGELAQSSSEAGEAEHINIYIDPASGLHARADERPDPLRWIFHLHATFFAGSTGKTLLGFVALALLVSSVTGVIIYWPFSKAQSFRAPATLIRNGGAGRRLYFADWHKLIGILSFAFQMLMAVTGLLLTFGTLVIQIYTYVLISELDRQASDSVNPTDWVALDRVYASARKIHGDERYIKTILFPGEVQGPRHFGVLAYGTGTFGQYIPQLSMLRAARDAEAAADMIIELPWYIKLIAAAAPLHFGNFGGLPLKIIYCVFGLTGGGLAITGYIMYFKKIRRRRREAASKLGAS